MKKSILVLAIIVFSLGQANAQQEFMITHYMHNSLFINPAYAGSQLGMSVSSLARQQWVGVDGAPNLQLVSLHTPITYRPISLGAVLFRDEIGLTSQTGGIFSYAYRIQLSRTVKLSMGLHLLANTNAINYGRATGDLMDLSDPNIGGNISEQHINFGTGLFLHSDYFYVGFSIPKIVKNKMGLEDPDGMFTETVRHMYLSAGYVFRWTPDLIVKPNVLVKQAENAPVQFDLNLNTMVKELLWLGVSYRSLESISGLVGLQVSPQLLVNYAHDFTVNQLDVSSHEVMISYVFERKNIRIETPRYF